MSEEVEPELVLVQAVLASEQSGGAVGTPPFCT